MMLRAMREALQAHAEAHPGEPFDHERHMPDCMREARDDPATWASGGSRGGGGFDEEVRRVAALKRIFCLVSCNTCLVSCNTRRFRHDVYARIAECEKDAWGMCGTLAQRDKATKQLAPGSRLHTAVTAPWDHAFLLAFNLKFDHQVGKGIPADCLGYTILGLAENDEGEG